MKFFKRMFETDGAKKLEEIALSLEKSLTTNEYIAGDLRKCRDENLRVNSLLFEYKTKAKNHDLLVENLRATIISETARLEGEMKTRSKREMILMDTVQMLCERGDISNEEIAQLGIGTLVPGIGKEKSTIQWIGLDDLKTMTEFSMKEQATVAKFRQIKGHFVQYQRAVKLILTNLDKVTRKNNPSAKDFDQIRDLRDTLASITGRDL